VRLRGTSLREEAVLTTGSTLLAVGLSGVASLVIARELGVAGRGTWAVISSSIALGTVVAGLGLPYAAAYAAGRAGGAARARAVRAGLVGAIPLGVAAVAVYALAALAGGGWQLTAALVAGAGLALIGPLHQTAQRLVLTTARATWFAAITLGEAAVVLVAVVAAAIVADLAPVGVVGLVGAATVAGTGLALIGLRRAGVLTGGAVAVRATLRPYRGYALATWATLGLTHTVQRADILLVGGFQGATQAGLYAVAAQVGELLLVAPAAIGNVIFRRTTTTAGDARAELRRALRATLAIAVPSAAIVGLAAGPLLRLLFGDAFEGADTALRLLLPGIVALSVQSVLSNHLAGLGRPGFVLRAWAAGAVVGLGLDLYAVPVHGIEGAAAAASVSYAVVLALHLLGLRRLERRPA
jgi:O-antigen/teichoic acid export membrane protein